MKTSRRAAEFTCPSCDGVIRVDVVFGCAPGGDHGEGIGVVNIRRANEV